MRSYVYKYFRVGWYMLRKCVRNGPKMMKELPYTERLLLSIFAAFSLLEVELQVGGGAHALRDNRADTHTPNTHNTHTQTHSECKRKDDDDPLPLPGSGTLTLARAAFVTAIIDSLRFRFAVSRPKPPRPTLSSTPTGSARPDPPLPSPAPAVNPILASIAKPLLEASSLVPRPCVPVVVQRVQYWICKHQSACGKVGCS